MKVLLIEEDPTMSDLLKLLLQPYRASVNVATSEHEAVEKVYSTQSDLVVLDRDKPINGSWDVIRNIRSISTVPILILSAQDDPMVVASALDAGADHYLVKPVSSGILLATIKTLMWRKSIALGRAFFWREQISIN